MGFTFWSIMAKNNIKTNVLFNSIYQLTNILVPLFTLPYLSRILHAEGLGSYSFAYSVSYYFYSFIRLGLHSYGNRTIAYVKDDRQNLSKTFFELYAMQFFMGVIMTVIYIAYCIWMAPIKSLAFIFLLLVISGGVDLTWALYGLEECKITSVRDIVTKILTAICIFIFVNNSDDVWKYALIYGLGFFANQVVVLPVIVKRVYYIKPDIKSVITHIKPNLILFLPTIAVNVYKTMDKIMIGLMSTESELGYYHSTENIIRVPLALVTALGTVMLPRMSNMISREEDTGDIQSIFDKSVMFAMFVSSSICLGIMAVAKEFVPIFYGAGFEKCVELFYIILPSCMFVAFANVIRTQFLLPRKQDVLYIVSLFVGALVNLILNTLLIPRYASIGAAFGTLAAEMIVCVVQAACVFKEACIGRNVANSVPFVFSGMLMFAIFRNFTLSAVNNEILSLLLKIIICGGFYLVVLGLQLVTMKKAKSVFM